MTTEKLIPHNASPGDQFGNSIFIFENYAIIGALKDSTQNQADPTGCAYIFKNGWPVEANLQAYASARRSK